MGLTADERERTGERAILYRTLADAIVAEAPHASVESVLDGGHDLILPQDYCATWDWSSYGVEDTPG